MPSQFQLSTFPMKYLISQFSSILSHDVADNYRDIVLLVDDLDMEHH